MSGLLKQDQTPQLRLLSAFPQKRRLPVLVIADDSDDDDGGYAAPAPPQINREALRRRRNPFTFGAGSTMSLGSAQSVASGIGVSSGGVSPVISAMSGRTSAHIGIGSARQSHMNHNHHRAGLGMNTTGDYHMSKEGRPKPPTPLQNRRQSAIVLPTTTAKPSSRSTNNHHGNANVNTAPYNHYPHPYPGFDAPFDAQLHAVPVPLQPLPLSRQHSTETTTTLSRGDSISRNTLHYSTVFLSNPHQSQHDNIHHMDAQQQQQQQQQDGAGLYAIAGQDDTRGGDDDDVDRPQYSHFSQAGRTMAATAAAAYLSPQQPPPLRQHDHHQQQQHHHHQPQPTSAQLPTRAQSPNPFTLETIYDPNQPFIRYAPSVNPTFSVYSGVSTGSTGGTPARSHLSKSRLTRRQSQQLHHTQYGGPMYHSSQGSISIQSQILIDSSRPTTPVQSGLGVGESIGGDSQLPRQLMTLNLDEGDGEESDHSQDGVHDVDINTSIQPVIVGDFPGHTGVVSHHGLPSHAQHHHQDQHHHQQAMLHPSHYHQQQQHHNQSNEGMLSVDAASSPLRHEYSPQISSNPRPSFLSTGGFSANTGLGPATTAAIGGTGAGPTMLGHSAYPGDAYAADETRSTYSSQSVYPSLYHGRAQMHVPYSNSTAALSGNQPIFTSVADAPPHYAHDQGRSPPPSHAYFNTPSKHKRTRTLFPVNEPSTSSSGDYVQIPQFSHVHPPQVPPNTQRQQ